MTPTGEQAAAWQAAKSTFERFAAADEYLFTVPMWNHGIPYILKQFIDVVSQPGMVFSFDPEAGYTGLLTGKKAAVIYTSAVYGAGPATVVRHRLPGAVPGQLAAMDRHRQHHRRRVPPEPRHQDADSDSQRAHSDARDAGKTF